LPEELYGHINSAFCDGIATTVTAAHHFTWKHLYASMQAAQIPASKLRFVTPDKESSMNTLWQEEDFQHICSRESLTEKAAEIGKNDLGERVQSTSIQIWRTSQHGCGSHRSKWAVP